jgi:site-specific DNA recombinase
VVVYRLDRWGRSQSVIFDGLELLEKHGIQFQSMTELFDTGTPAGRATLETIATFAGLERDAILQRSWDGMKRVASEGAWMGGVAPFGYRVIGHDAAARLEVAEPEAEVIRLIYRLITESGYGCPRVASHLQSLGIPTPHYFRQRKGRPANFWRAVSIWQIVVNPVYMGRHRWGRDGKRGTVIEREVPPIVTEATWNAAQTWLTANKKFSPRNPKNAYLLKGLVRCARCGYTFIGTQWKNGK